VTGDPHLRDWAAIILAVGLALAVNIITAAVLWDAVRSAGPGLSENATQVITGAFGGMVGILGSYLGYRTGSQGRTGNDEPGANDSGA
jgi:predicted small secreted protein